MLENAPFSSETPVSYLLLNGEDLVPDPPPHPTPFLTARKLESTCSEATSRWSSCRPVSLTSLTLISIPFASDFLPDHDFTTGVLLGSLPQCFSQDKPGRNK